MMDLRGSSSLHAQNPTRLRNLSFEGKQYAHPRVDLGTLARWDFAACA